MFHFVIPTGPRSPPRPCFGKSILRRFPSSLPYTDRNHAAGPENTEEFQFISPFQDIPSISFQRDNQQKSTKTSWVWDMGCPSKPMVEKAISSLQISSIQVPCCCIPQFPLSVFLYSGCHYTRHPYNLMAQDLPVPLNIGCKSACTCRAFLFRLVSIAKNKLPSGSHGNGQFPVNGKFQSENHL